MLILRRLDSLITLITVIWSSGTNDNSVSVKDLFQVAWYPTLPVWTLSLCNILLFLLWHFYNHLFFLMLAISIVLHHSYCNIVFIIIQFKKCLYIFCITCTIKVLFSITVFLRKKWLLKEDLIYERNIKIIYSSLKDTASLCFLLRI